MGQSTSSIERSKIRFTTTFTLEMKQESNWWNTGIQKKEKQELNPNLKKKKRQHCTALSAAVINTMPQQLGGRKGLFCLTLPGHSPFEGHKGRNPQQKREEPPCAVRIPG